MWDGYSNRSTLVMPHATRRYMETNVLNAVQLDTITLTVCHSN